MASATIEPGGTQKQLHDQADVIDEFPHECLAIRVMRRLKAMDVTDALSN